MKKFVSAMCCAGLFSGVVSSVGQAKPKLLKPLEVQMPLPRLEVEDGGSRLGFCVVLGGRKVRTGHYIAYEDKVIGNKLVVAGKSPELFYNVGKTFRSLGLGLAAGSRVDKLSSDEYGCLKDFDEAISSRVKEKWGVSDFHLTTAEIGSILFSAMSEFAHSVSLDKRFDVFGAMNRQGYYLVDEDPNNISKVFEKLAEVSGYYKDRKISRKDKENALTTFINLWNRLEPSWDEYKRINLEEYDFFRKWFVPKGEHDKTVKKLNENIDGLYELNEGLNRKLSNYKKDNNNLKSEKEKLKGTVREFGRMIDILGYTALVGWSLLAFKCVKDWFFGGKQQFLEKTTTKRGGK